MPGSIEVAVFVEWQPKHRTASGWLMVRPAASIKLEGDVLVAPNVQSNPSMARKKLTRLSYGTPSFSKT
jgi:hypothetical protein